MDKAEFDRFALEYEAVHRENIRISGEEPDYFARYKVDAVAREWARAGLAPPRAILDFGTGVGNSIPHLAARFPDARLTGLDVSSQSLALAGQRFPGRAELIAYDGGAMPLAAGGMDLIFSSCVFHHIPFAEHHGVLSELRRLLAPGGRMIVFEHNPLNPVTRYIVATCPFDANAVLIPAGAFKARQMKAGFSRVSASFTGFFPSALKALRPLEPWMAALPFGAQYYTLAHG